MLDDNSARNPSQQCPANYAAHQYRYVGLSDDRVRNAYQQPDQGAGHEPGQRELAKRDQKTDSETAGELHDRMKMIGAQLLVKTVKGLIDGSIKELPQETAIADNTAETLFHAPKLSTETCQLDFKNDVASIYNKVRGLSPYPGAFTTLNGKILKIFKAEKEMSSQNIEPGSVKTDQKTFLKFACADGFLDVSDIQLEGKKRMPVTDFLRGYRIENISTANS